MPVRLMFHSGTVRPREFSKGPILPCKHSLTAYLMVLLLLILLAALKISRFFAKILRDHYL